FSAPYGGTPIARISNRRAAPLVSFRIRSSPGSRRQGFANNGFWTLAMVILVVEDECLLNIITSDDLRSAGYEVESAYNADEAIDILEHRDDIGTLLTDIDMP